MDSIIKNLDRSGCFYSSINANTGEGTGAQITLEGLIPIEFLLQLMGVKIIPDQEIIIEGEYPFSWPVILRYRGIIIRRNQEHTRVIIPGEETLLIKGSDKEVISMS